MMADDSITDEAFRALFDGESLRCPEPDCGHEYEDGELGEPDLDDDGVPLDEGLTVRAVLATYRASPTAARILLAMADVRCPECQSQEVPAPVPVNHLDEYGAALADLYEHAAMIVERIPSMREAIEEKIAEAQERSLRVILGARS